MEITQNLLEKYAKLIVKCGVNVQPGQDVSIICSVNIASFAELVVKECYLAGAKKVSMDWKCGGIERLHYQYADEEVLSIVPDWQVEKLKQNVKDLPAMIHIVSEDPDELAGVDVDKMTRILQKKAPVTKPYRDAMNGKYQWLVVGYPSPAWAKKLFPEMSEEEAMLALWNAILKTMRIDEENDPVALWKEHADQLTARSRWLNEQKFTSLKYSSENGTDFTVGLIPGALWESAGMTNPQNGAFYIPNMPTEEVFTSPMAGVCEGTLTATKPLSWNGQLIEDFSITFEKGRAVSCRANKGQELLEKMIHMDETAGMLGEVALVPWESPVNRTGVLFLSTLYDENACCHFAIGQGFPELVADGKDISVQEAKEKGVNDSLIHVDFMVGAPDLKIVGIREDGSEMPIFINGTWA